MGGTLAGRKLQLVKEATPGTRVELCTAIWRGEVRGFDDQRVIEFVKENVGLFPGANRTYSPKSYGVLEIPETPATFEQLPYLLEMGIVAETPAADANSATTYVYEYPLPTTPPAAATRSYSLQCGDEQEMERGDFATLEQLVLSMAQGQAWMMGGKLFTQDVTRNVYSAATISFVSSGKHIQDSANGLGGFKVGQKIKVSGSSEAANNTTFTVASVVGAGDITVSENVTDQAATPIVTLAETFSVIALPTVEEILGSKTYLYINAAGGTLGQTAKSATLLAAKLTIDSGRVPSWAGSTNLKFTGLNLDREKLSVKLDLTCEFDGTATDEKAAWRAQTGRLIRLKVLGNAVADPGDNYTTKALVIDLAGKWEKFAVIDQQDGNDIITGTFRAEYSSGDSLFAKVTVVNELASLT